MPKATRCIATPIDSGPRGRRRVAELWLRRGDGRRFGPPRVMLERYGIC